MSLWQDIERACHSIKHLDRDDLDVEEIRLILRRCQTLAELADVRGARFDLGETHLTITVECDDPIATLAALHEANHGDD